MPTHSTGAPILSRLKIWLLALASLLAAQTLAPSKGWAGQGLEATWNDEARFTALRTAIDGVAQQGLTPGDYGAEALAGQTGKPGPDRDRIANQALTLLVTDLRHGKVDAVGFQPIKPSAADAEQAQAIAAAPDLTAALAGIAPTHPLYKALLIDLELYRAIAAKGGWAAVAPGPSLSLGARDPRVAQIAARLRLTGDLRTPVDDETAFGEPLKAAVMGFQRRMGLTPDGVVGPGVLTEMNRPVAERVAQLRVNIDRARGIMNDLPPRFLIVNIAAYQVYLVEDQTVVWRARVQVGKPFRQTPQLRSAINQLVLNPTWTVPPTILTQDIAPAALKDPNYIQSRKLMVTNRSGQVMDPRTINWRGPLPYTLRQPPGPDNAMGRVKFLFPNPYSVYLHDTPAKTLFDSPDRSFSSGCVRLERPLELAAHLLADEDESWTPDRLASTLADLKTHNVPLKKPVPILMTYSTAWVDPGGTVNFRRDVYGLDARWATALDRPGR
jgi:murein L,D-transpeptidase YcbB/YkuD